MNNVTRVLTSVGSLIVGAILLLMVAVGSFTQIDQGERGVHLRNGEVVGILQPGFEFTLPLLDSVKRLDVRDQNLRLEMSTYSYDQQPTNLMVSVSWALPEANVGQAYVGFGSLDAVKERVVIPRARDAIKNTFGKFTAAQAVQNREKLAQDTLESVRKAFENTVVNAVSVQFEVVEFSKAYEQSIENRMLAQVQIETTRQQKETAAIQAEIKVVQAEANARAQREQYQAQADGIRLRGEAEADAIKAKAQALAQNTNLVNLNAVDKWDGKLPAQMVPGSAVPFVNLK